MVDECSSGVECSEDHKGVRKELVQVSGNDRLIVNFAIRELQPIR